MGLTQGQYFAVSLAAASAVMYHAFATRQRFYHAAVYLSTSKLAVAVVGNLAFATALVVHKLMIKMFLGSLRDIEREMIRERLSSAVMETLLALTVFREEFSGYFVAMFATLVFIKVLHWLVQDRVDYIEVTPSISRLQHLRIVSFMSLLLVIDGLFLQYTVHGTVQSAGASVMLLFAFEYVILASEVIRYFLKYAMSMVALWLEGRWESKGTYVFYLELIIDMLHLVVYVVFFVIVMSNYGLPLHLVRDLYSTFRNFRNRIADFLRFRQVTARLDRLPDATPADLTRSDGVCIICREEMTGAGSNKKLHCGHVFHLHCLRSWLERQQNCPTCRATVFRQGPPAAGAAAPGAAAAPAAPGAAADGAARAAPAAGGAPAPAAGGAAGQAGAAAAQPHAHGPHVFHLPHQHHVHLAHRGQPVPPSAAGSSGGAPPGQGARGAHAGVHIPGMPPPGLLDMLDLQALGMMGGGFNPGMMGMMAGPMFPTVLPPLFPPPNPNNPLEQQAAAAAAAAALAAATAVGAFNPLGGLIMLPPAFLPGAAAAAAPGGAAAGTSSDTAAGGAPTVPSGAISPDALAAVIGSDPNMARAMEQMLEKQVAALSDQLTALKAAQAKAAEAAAAAPAAAPGPSSSTPAAAAATGSGSAGGSGAGPSTSTTPAAAAAAATPPAPSSSAASTGTAAPAATASAPVSAPAAPSASNAVGTSVSTPTASTAAVAQAAPAETPTKPAAAAAPSTSSASPATTTQVASTTPAGAAGAGSSSGEGVSDEQEEIRRKRLARFQEAGEK
eukprot:CAMPEP_0202888406 /NCGR_PEP_ID=MMETSP1391-20130828/43168_1 /ASSEMBLY_ACC=CAM_ASM_000867 /TAXON_ID=1034604 /ORGANISM="Chlamydomonas leiostraca, Strain SAG 11-49" /LENGTH=784 /DNA_ID=CAMNT_0049571707 /DNA_START=64 /DNA_END=2418 /DNA_ORIENTATION=-